MPELQGFNFVGGAALSPEFAALLVGLATYTAAFIAEIVRAGILAVDRGQGEAAHALGLSRAQTMRLIVLPQALRVIVPPMTSQYLNLTKNSSLAVAIGYPDLVSIANTTMNQTGQAIEGIAIIMAVYLTISLSISALHELVQRAGRLAKSRSGRATNLFGVVAEHGARDAAPALVALEDRAAVHRLGVPRRGLAARCQGLPRDRGRLLGLHRREAPLHPVRHLSLRAALAAGARDRPPDRPVGFFCRSAFLELVARARLDVRLDRPSAS